MSNKQILIIEDEAHVRGILARVLSKKEYKVTIAENAHEALNLLNQLHVDLILTDLYMPVMNGNQFVQALANIAPDVPVITITATPEDVVAHPQIKGILSKPFKLSKLWELVEEQLIS